MSLDPLFDFAIVGAGIAGATLAARLAGQGSVLLLEREDQPGYHSTGRSAAMFMASYGPPQARALTRASRAFYAGFLSPRGALYVGWQGQQALIDQTLRTLQASDPSVERLDAAASLQRVPVLRAKGLIGAVLEPGAMDMDVHGLHQQALSRARAQGAQLWLAAELTRAECVNGYWQLQLGHGDSRRSARAARLVNAAGAWADETALRCGAKALGVQPRRRSAFSFDAPSNAARDWPGVVGIDESWYFKPDAGQLLGSPANADPVAAHDVQAEELDIALGIARIQQHTSLLIRRPRRVWAGLRSFASDGELVIGPDPLARGLFWLAGQGGYGIQSAAGAACLAEALLLGAAIPEVLRAQGVEPEAMNPRRLHHSAA